MSQAMIPRGTQLHGKGETGPGDSFDLWKRRLQCLWSDGTAWDIFPLWRCCIAFLISCIFWSATCICPMQLLFVWASFSSEHTQPYSCCLCYGALTQCVTVSCPLTRRAESSSPPHARPILAPATSRLELQVRGFGIPQEDLGRCGTTLLGEGVPFSPLPLLPLTRHTALLPPCSPELAPHPFPLAAERKGHGVQRGGDTGCREEVCLCPLPHRLRPAHPQ